MTERWAARITITVAARRTGLSESTVRRYVRRGLVSEVLTEADLARLRRIRRLTDLGVNLAGAEIILPMRRRIHRKSVLNFNNCISRYALALDRC